VPELLRELLEVARDFFALPEAEKLAIEMVNSPHFRGYNRVARELTRGTPDWREQIDIGAERPALAHSAGLPAWARLQGRISGQKACRSCVRRSRVGRVRRSRWRSAY